MKRWFKAASIRALKTLAQTAAQNTGGGGAHNNMPPFRVVNFIIATGKTS